MNPKHLATADFQSGFYPTPEALAVKALAGIQWHQVESVLEPSAGKGDFIRVAKRLWKYDDDYGTEKDIDCVEVDPTLRATLKGDGFRVVHYDFLTFRTLKQYSLIIMNPPFDEGAAHLHKALDLIDFGGSVVCILSAETLKNPFTNERKHLLQRLTDCNASIEYVEGAFANAERPTDVSVAIIRCSVENVVADSLLIDNLRKAKPHAVHNTEPDKLIDADYEQAIIDRYNFEAVAGVMLIEEYDAMKPYILDGTEKHSRPILRLSIDNHDACVNDYLRNLRRRYWSTLFADNKFVANLTSNVSRTLMTKVNELGEYDFTHYNIQQLRIDTFGTLLLGIKETIMKLFDDWTYTNAWYDGSKNIHYYNGWATNKAFKVAGKVIIPFHHKVWNEYSGKFHPTGFGIGNKLADIERVFDHLSGNPSNIKMVDFRLKEAERIGCSKDVPFRYFKATFYKKGTVHLEFTDEEVLYRFNLFAALGKLWLPPCYGKKHYRDMAPEEQAVIDGFEGEARYEQTMLNPSVYLADEHLLLNAG